MENNINNEVNSSKNDLKNEVKIKNDIKSILYKFASKIISNIAVIIPIIIFLKEWAFITILLMLIFDLIYVFLSWINEYILLLEDEARYHYGIFSKNTMIIPKNNIKSMDISVNLLERILKYSNVKIESPVNGGELEQINMYLSNENIDKLKSFAFIGTDNILKQDNIKVEEETYKNETNSYSRIVSNKELFKYGLTSFNILIIIAVGFKGYSVVESFIKDSAINDMISNSTTYLAEKFTLVFGIIGIIILIVFLKFAAIIYYMIKYYNFTVSKTKDTINIKYGLINNREFSFNVNNVKSIKLKANAFRQMIKEYEIVVDVKGYSDSGDKKIILFPIGNEIEVFNILKELLPNWVITGDGEGIERGKLMLVLRPSIIIFLISGILYLIFKTNYVFLINLLLILVIPNAILKGKNLNLKINKNKINAVSGGLIKTKYLLNKRDIQAVEFKTTPFLKKHSLGKISIYCYSEIEEKINLNYMKEAHVSEIITK